MGYNLLAENWTVTSVPCSFWLIKEILIYCHCNSSVSGANRPAEAGLPATVRTTATRTGSWGRDRSPSGHCQPVFLGLEGTE